jgi:ubiquinone/menaquinone biosynthesis C-methylase UbiE
MEVFNDYDFLARYVRKDNTLSAHQILAGKIIKNLKINSILDIGGGTHSYISSLGKEYDTAIVDLSAESLQNIHSKWKLVGELPDIPVRAKAFQLVSALEVLEHIDPLIYEDSIREISRITNRYVLISAPFLQDLSGAYVLCDRCRTVFQCEGHVRQFNFKKIEALQRYFGGLSDLYFLGQELGSYLLTLNTVTIKSIVRRFLQKEFKRKYCHPPFTKCPKCGKEIFNNYYEYLNGKDTLHTNMAWWNRKDNAIIGSSFVSLFEKCAPHVYL